MANKKYAEINHTHDVPSWLIIISCIAIGTFLGSLIAFNFVSNDIDDLKEEINILKTDGKTFYFNVECEGNNIIASANHSTDSYELYKKMIKIYDTENCEIYDAYVSEGEQNG